MALGGQDAAQQTVYQALTNQPQHVDELAEKLNLPSSAISVTLTELELTEATQNTGGQRYVRR